jgi:hypothetical protein
MIQKQKRYVCRCTSVHAAWEEKSKVTRSNPGEVDLYARNLIIKTLSTTLDAKCKIRDDRRQT